MFSAGSDLTVTAPDVNQLEVTFLAPPFIFPEAAGQTNGTNTTTTPTANTTATVNGTTVAVNGTTAAIDSPR